MAQKLTDLVITKVALVDEGSCSAAHIKLYKRKEEGGTNMTFEEIVKSLPADQVEVVTAEIAKAKGELPEGAISADDKKQLELEKQVAMDEVESLKKAATPGTSEEDILKSADLDPAVKALVEKSIARSKAAEGEILKMREVQETAECIAKAKEVALIPEADTKVVELLKSVKGIPGVQDQVLDILKSANALIEKGTAFKEVGTGSNVGSGTSAESAWALIEKAAAALVVKGQVSKEKAIEMVTTQQPQLYNDYLSALRSAE